MLALEVLEGWQRASCKLSTALVFLLYIRRLS